MFVGILQGMGNTNNFYYEGKEVIRGWLYRILGK